MTTRAQDTPIADAAPIEDLSDAALRSAPGGRINLRDGGPGKPPTQDSHGSGGPLHPGDDRFNIYWPHGY